MWIVGLVFCGKLRGRKKLSSPHSEMWLIKLCYFFKYFLDYVIFPKEFYMLPPLFKKKKKTRIICQGFDLIGLDFNNSKGILMSFNPLIHELEN